MRFIRNQRGVIMIGAFIITLFFVAVSLAVAEFGVQHYVNTKRTVSEYSALAAAEAGGDRFMNEINASSTYQGTNNAPSNATDSCTGYTQTPVVLTNTTADGKVTYEDCQKAGTIANEKIVYATGKLYQPATASTPKVTRKLKLVINSTTTAAAGYAVQTGPGGLVMSNGASITSDQVYIGGQLSMSNNSRIGSSAKPTNLYVANQACPAGGGSSYPATCTSGQGNYRNPIYACCGPQKMIYGNVHAVNFQPSSDYDTNRTLSLMTSAGYVDNIVPAVSMPADNRAALKAAGFPISRAASSAQCPWPTNATTWAGGTHFTGGDINISNNCVVTVTGDIWIDGGLVLSNNTSLISAVPGGGVANIMIDGSNGFKPSNNSSMASSTSGGNAFNVTTYWANAPCSPNCTTLTGSQLYNSQQNETIVTSNNFTAAGTSLYSRWSALHITNNTAVGPLAGQRISLDNNGTITIGTGSSGGGGGTTTWAVRYYEQIYK